MSSYDGAEVCKLVGFILLDELAELLRKETVGLYRDDGLAFVNASGPHMKLTKKILKLFQTHDLQVTTECNLSRIDFLDVSFDLQFKSFKPSHKPGETPLHVKIRSSHSNVDEEGNAQDDIRPHIQHI